MQNAVKCLRVDVAINADTTTAAQLNRHIATLPAGMRWAGASEAAGWAVGAASDTITGTNVLAVSGLGSSVWQSSLRHRKSWLTWIPAARAISESTALVQDRLQRAALCPRETSADGAR
jgi:hypothetical protein